MSERSLLADAIETYFGELSTPEVVAAIEAGDDGQPLWAATEELGFTLTSTPEDAGGGGGSLIDGLTVLRAAGRHAVPLPLAETDLLAGWLLAAAGIPVGAGPSTLAPVRPEDRLRLRRDGESLRLDGTALRVPWATTATRLIAIAADESEEFFVASIDPAATKMTAGTNLVAEARDTVEFDDVVVDWASWAPLPLPYETVYLRGALARSAQMLGALERTRDLTIAYSKERVQFGRPLAKFQVIQHHVAQIARDVALAEAAVDLAASAAVENPESCLLEVASAKIMTGRAATAVSAIAHQVHGAIGVTKEYPLSILTRRLWDWREEFGSERYWAQRIGSEAWRSGEDVWAFATSGRSPAMAARTA